MSKLVVFAGPPCSGKSTVGNLLGWPHIEMDAVRARILPDAAHTRADRQVAYRAVLLLAEYLLRYEPIVIVNGGFGQQEQRDELRLMCRSCSADLFLVEFTVPLQIALQRNRARQGHHPGLDLTDERVRQLVEEYPWLRTGLMVDSTQPAEICAAAVRDYVAGPAASLPTLNL